MQSSDQMVHDTKVMDALIATKFGLQQFNTLIRIEYTQRNRQNTLDFIKSNLVGSADLLNLVIVVDDCYSKGLFQPIYQKSCNCHSTLNLPSESAISVVIMYELVKDIDYYFTVVDNKKDQQFELLLLQYGIKKQIVKSPKDFLESLKI